LDIATAARFLQRVDPSAVAKHKIGTAIVDEVANLLWCIGGVKRQENNPGTNTGKDDGKRMLRLLQLQGDPVARRNP